MMLSDVFDRKVIEEFTVKPEIAVMTKEERFALLNRLFQTEYQGKIVTYAMLERELFVHTAAVTRTHFGFFRRKGSFKGYMTKLNLTAGGDYIPLISNCEYVRSADEKKPEQNSFHRDTKQWHYFTKDILCDGERYRVQIDVREDKKRVATVYSVALTPVVAGLELAPEKERGRGSTNSAPQLTDLKGGTSSKSTITQSDEKVKKNNKKSQKKPLTEQIRAAGKHSGGRAADKKRGHKEKTR